MLLFRCITTMVKWQENRLARWNDSGSAGDVSVSVYAGTKTTSVKSSTNKYESGNYRCINLFGYSVAVQNIQFSLNHSY
ncbi:hypothetical protein [Thermaerobacillus caldiproteolyticus]|uniref:Uncharacterized protein n=1 Tax=Thermaerobacillus caldiproteolyticus TaxID=247480 RepID=A0A7V9Z6W5_9BACL|nr:hypothetical protein [Anoxybacillus caldiproteolyticus]MBA2875116.1 hypothetical protein [Anoxybacillus caldiproteolyticus]